ncbi:putative dimethyladenosine transferase [Nosema granulosis]|uniref:rRNA adenine N(6)-methyltransferase n=1 Tax=Nosema granulosis TaxID=83296 RepID=A0A9P6H0Z7_9MICR|nr:putative dimethyladenosine transferase [Nosema granulosis]
MVNPKFNKDLGQHILKNMGVVDTVIEKAKIKPTDVILEIGGGTGNLTMKMLPKAKKVVVYEKDPRLASELVKKVNDKKELANKFQLFIGDALKHDFPYFDMCISNLPYQISSPFVFKLLTYNFKCAYIMFQKEFGDRLIARPGSPNYCRLSVSVQLLAQVDYIMKVSKNSFVPPPKVESCIIRIEPKLPRPPINLEEFDALLKVCFLRKNKTILSNFRSSTFIKKLKKDKQIAEPEAFIKEIITKLGFENSRANKMDIDDFLELLLEFKRFDIDLV